MSSDSERPWWIFVEAYQGQAERSIVFLFATARAAVPVAVVKVRRNQSGGISLRRERDVLERMRRGEMRETVPTVRAFAEKDGWEILTLAPARVRPCIAP